MPTHIRSARFSPYAGLLLALPVVIWLWVLFRYAANVVFNDDYALLVFVARWQDPAISWTDRFTDLIALHNTHRIIYDRLVSLGAFYLTGQLNIKLLIWLGNLSLVGICWQLWRGFRQLGQPIWYFLPIPFWIFSLQSHENMFWGMAALQNFTVIWFVQEALHQLHRRAPIGWPLLLSIAATLTSGNGILAFLIGTLLLISQQRRDRTIWIWGSSTALVLIVMLGLSSVAHERTPFMTWLPNLCLALGSAFTNQTNTTVPLAGGFMLTALLATALLVWVTSLGTLGQRLRRITIVPEWLAFGVFIGATALLLAMHRLPDELLRDRYKLYAHLMLSLVYLLVLAMIGPRLKMGWALGTTLLAAVMNVGAFHACLPRIVIDFQQRQADAFNFLNNGSTLPIPYLRQYADSLLTSVHRQQIYQFSNTIPPPTAWSTGSATDTLMISSYQDDFIHNSFLGDHPCYITIDNQTLPFHLMDGTDKGTFIAIQGADRHTYLFPAAPRKGSLRDFVTARGPFSTGSSLSFLSSRLKPGDYQVQILRIVDDSYQLLGASQPLAIRSIY